MRADNKLAPPTDAHTDDAALKARDGLAASELKLTRSAAAPGVLNQVAAVEEQPVVNADNAATIGNVTPADDDISDGES